MPLTPRFCSQCREGLVRKLLDGRERDVCPACGTVFYRNPLPVAAALVLSPQREVLLVRRGHEPFRGMWCLPIGFAELDETIADAALRELREEAGIEGQVLRLIAADSSQSEFYGDLLIVTFEVLRLRGEPRPGDDAEAAAWFPIERLPPLAFPANERAVAICREAHREEWAIRDSFARLQQPDGLELLSDALVTLVRDRATEVAGLWLAEVLGNPTTPSYRRIEPELLLQRASGALSQFGRWLKGDEANEEVRQFYRSLGAERRAQGFALHEVLSSLTLLRKHVWTFARGQGVWEKPLEVYRVLELDRRIVAFFDRAIHATARGYENGG